MIDPQKRWVIRRTRSAEPIALLSNKTYDVFVRGLPSPREISETEYLDEARVFGSRLAAIGMMMTHEPYMIGETRHDWEATTLDKCKIKPRPYEPPFALARPCPLRAIEEIAAAHGEYCERIERWLRRAGVPEEDLSRGRPIAEVAFGAPRWGGVYSPTDHRCTYALMYALTAPDYMERVVSHECVHAYQRAFCGRDGQAHGDVFYALSYRAAGVKAERHTLPSVPEYSQPLVAELSQHARPWLLSQLELGLFAATSVEVDSDSLTRDREGAIE